MKESDICENFHVFLADIRFSYYLCTRNTKVGIAQLVRVSP